MTINEQTYWSRVHRGPACWIWQGTVLADGYGQYGLGVERRAHRISYLLTHGDIPEGMHVLHHCDVPLCVRPDHLYAGTERDNAKDRESRGRASDARLRNLRPGNGPGMETPNAKLTTEQVAEIRRLYQSNPGRRPTPYSQAEIARRYGVSQQQVSKILRGQQRSRA